MVTNMTSNFVPSALPATQTASNTNTEVDQNAQPAAMIALYSVAGVVLSLFFLILIIGGIRAKMHPERYGTQTANDRRPPRVRARGIAAAILDTVSVVKVFGETPKAEDLEKQISVQSSPTIPTNEKMQPNVNESKSDLSIDFNDFALTACPICYEEFSDGEQIRVLSCRHIFHTECVDPWLLNISSVCPMCRINLAPERSEPEDDTPQSDNQATGSELDVPTLTVTDPSGSAEQIGSSTPIVRETVSETSSSRRSSQGKSVVQYFARYIDIMRDRRASNREEAITQLAEERRRRGTNSLEPPVLSATPLGRIRTFLGMETPSFRRDIGRGGDYPDDAISLNSQ